ncbi:unnamed protein product [Caenorhabditis auriculariae]|uniref:Uncharacterized protein n=1 Tax=Caenorhabditis auriculariae TaxID=2777116 RepID=A0A8S1H6I0_9PELO|nr:unnamed protein product [Caenorhabditis auriculariae]
MMIHMAMRPTQPQNFDSQLVFERRPCPIPEVYGRPATNPEKTELLSCATDEECQLPSRYCFIGEQPFYSDTKRPGICVEAQNFKICKNSLQCDADEFCDKSTKKTKFGDATIKICFKVPSVPGTVHRDPKTSDVMFCDTTCVPIDAVCRPLNKVLNQYKGICIQATLDTNNNNFNVYTLENGEECNVNEDCDTSSFFTRKTEEEKMSFTRSCVDVKNYKLCIHLSLDDRLCNSEEKAVRSDDGTSQKCISKSRDNNLPESTTQKTESTTKKTEPTTQKTEPTTSMVEDDFTTSFYLTESPQTTEESAAISEASKRKEEEESHSGLFFILASVAAVLILVAIGGVATFILFKKKKARKNEKRDRKAKKEDKKKGRASSTTTATGQRTSGASNSVSNAV